MLHQSAKLMLYGAQIVAEHFDEIRVYLQRPTVAGFSIV